MSYSLKVPEGRQKQICHLFQTMNRSNENHPDSIGFDWLQKHGQSFAGFVNGTWLASEDISKESASICKISDFFSGKELAQIHIPSQETFQLAAKNSFDGFQKWSSFTAVERAKYIYSVGKHIEENLQLFSVVESLTTGKHLHKTRNKDVPHLVQTFYHDSSISLKCDESWKPTGVICVVAEEFNNPLLSASWQISSILAAGNSAFLLVDAKSFLSAFLLCEICCTAGLPPGVLNVLPTCQESQSFLPKVSKVVFSGSTMRSNIYIDLAIKSGIPIDISTPQRTTVIVYSGSDLHAAANSVLDILAFNDTRAQSSGCNVLYQDSIEEEFLKLLKGKIEKIFTGGNLTNSDLSCIVMEQQKHDLDLFIAEEKKLNTEITFGPCIDNPNYSYYRPVLLCNARTLFKKKCDNLKGPIIFGNNFRTIKESINIFNHQKQASAVSLWVEKISVALEVASKLESTVVWVNSQNIFSPQAVHSSVHLSGNIDQGGDAGMISCININKSEITLSQVDTNDIESYGIEKTYADKISNKSNKSSEKIHGIFINGEFKPVSDGSCSDVQNAVSCAIAAQQKWKSISKGKCTQILISIAETLKKKKEDFATELHELTGNSSEQCNKEIEESVKKILYYASFDIDCLQKNDMCKESSLQVLQHRSPLGVIGIQCPDDNPLLSFLSLALPAVVFGNAVVVIPSQQYPMIALKICEVFKACGVPPGVFNVISGDRSYLTRHLSLNLEVGAIWFSVNGFGFIYNSLKSYPKKVFYIDIDWFESSEKIQALKFAMACTYNKTLYLPFGDIFAN
ncbi:aldehyde dehydrogenase family 16 member A1-like [Uloborus diversus]|uniref:aldehyde dehydrogenase family 16 member A1-like n=1 Tax=Uloborus diversus TaxID=327109 RepID=UPI002409F4E0|nr:aldehyde dehydrogenase family 16 member A1-like [Uloborus diversus]